MVIVILEIFGHVLLVISILRQRRLLRNNYYFLVLHLAIRELGWLVFTLFVIIDRYFAEAGLLKMAIISCFSRYLRHVFKFVGIYIMLVIAILRFYVSLYPLKLDISRRKLKVICCLGYILGLVVQCATSVPRCFLQKTLVDYMNKICLFVRGIVIVFCSDFIYGCAVL